MLRVLLQRHLRTGQSMLYVDNAETSPGHQQGVFIAAHESYVWDCTVEEPDFELGHESRTSLTDFDQVCELISTRHPMLLILRQFYDAHRVHVTPDEPSDGISHVRLAKGDQSTEDGGGDSAGSSSSECWRPQPPQAARGVVLVGAAHDTASSASDTDAVARWVAQQDACPTLESVTHFLNSGGLGLSGSTLDHATISAVADGLADIWREQRRVTWRERQHATGEHEAADTAAEEGASGAVKAQNRRMREVISFYAEAWTALKALQPAATLALRTARELGLLEALRMLGVSAVGIGSSGQRTTAQRIAQEVRPAFRTALQIPGGYTSVYQGQSSDARSTSQAARQHGVARKDIVATLDTPVFAAHGPLQNVASTAGVLAMPGLAGLVAARVQGYEERGEPFLIITTVSGQHYVSSQAAVVFVRSCYAGVLGPDYAFVTPSDRPFVYDSSIRWGDGARRARRALRTWGPVSQHARRDAKRMTSELCSEHVLPEDVSGRIPMVVAQWAAAQLISQVLSKVTDTPIIAYDSAQRDTALAHFRESFMLRLVETGSAGPGFPIVRAHIITINAGNPEQLILEQGGTVALTLQGGGIELLADVQQALEGTGRDYIDGSQLRFVMHVPTTAAIVFRLFAPARGPLVSCASQSRRTAPHGRSNRRRDDRADAPSEASMSAFYSNWRSWVSFLEKPMALARVDTAEFIKALVREEADSELAVAVRRAVETQLSSSNEVAGSDGEHAQEPVTTDIPLQAAHPIVAGLLCEGAADVLIVASTQLYVGQRIGIQCTQNHARRAAQREELEHNAARAGCDRRVVEACWQRTRAYGKWHVVGLLTVDGVYEPTEAQELGGWAALAQRAVMSEEQLRSYRGGKWTAIVVSDPHWLDTDSSNAIGPQEPDENGIRRPTARLPVRALWGPSQTTMYSDSAVADAEAVLADSGPQTDNEEAWSWSDEQAWIAREEEDEVPWTLVGQSTTTAESKQAFHKRWTELLADTPWSKHSPYRPEEPESQDDEGSTPQVVLRIASLVIEQGEQLVVQRRDDRTVGLVEGLVPSLSGEELRRIDRDQDVESWSDLRVLQGAIEALFGGSAVEDTLQSLTRLACLGEPVAEVERRHSAVDYTGFKSSTSAVSRVVVRVLYRVSLPDVVDWTCASAQPAVQLHRIGARAQNADNYIPHLLRTTQDNTRMAVMAPADRAQDTPWAIDAFVQPSPIARSGTTGSLAMGTLTAVAERFAHTGRSPVALALHKFAEQPMRTTAEALVALEECADRCTKARVRANRKKSEKEQVAVGSFENWVWTLLDDEDRHGQSTHESVAHLAHVPVPGVMFQRMVQQGHMVCYAAAQSWPAAVWTQWRKIRTITFSNTDTGAVVTAIVESERVCTTSEREERRAATDAGADALWLPPATDVTHRIAVRMPKSMRTPRYGPWGAGVSAVECVRCARCIQRHARRWLQQRDAQREAPWRDSCGREHMARVVFFDPLERLVFAGRFNDVHIGLTKGGRYAERGTPGCGLDFPGDSRRVKDADTEAAAWRGCGTLGLPDDAYTALVAAMHTKPCTGEHTHPVTGQVHLVSVWAVCVTGELLRAIDLAAEKAPFSWTGIGIYEMVELLEQVFYEHTVVAAATAARALTEASTDSESDAASSTGDDAAETSAQQQRAAQVLQRANRSKGSRRTFEESLAAMRGRIAYYARTVRERRLAACDIQQACRSKGSRHTFKESLAAVRERIARMAATRREEERAAMRERVDRRRRLRAAHKIQGYVRSMIRRAAPEQRRCTVCGHMKGDTAFTANQWRNGKRRKCSDCQQARALANHTAGEESSQCS